MFRFLWKCFPIFYTLPFLMATMRLPQIASMGLALRWLVLLSGTGCAVAIGFNSRIMGGKRIKLVTADYIILAFLLVFLASDLWSIQPTYTAQRAISLFLLYASSFFSLWKYADCFSEERLIRTILRTLGVLLVLNLASVVVVPGGILAGRFRGLFVNPNNIGLLMSLSVPLSVAQWLRSRRKVDLLIILIFGLNLAASGSRSALLSSGIAIFITLIPLMAKRPQQVIFFSILGGVGISLFAQTEFFADQVLREGSIATASNRTFFWELGREYIANRPDFGHGFGTDAVIHDHYNIVLSDLQLRGSGVMSSYYGLAVQMGWPITYLFFSCLWFFIAHTLLNHWRNYDLVSLVGTLAGALVVCIFEPALFSAGNIFAFLFWMVVMFAVRRSLYQKKGIMRI